MAGKARRASRQDRQHQNRYRVVLLRRGCRWGLHQGASRNDWQEVPMRFEAPVAVRGAMGGRERQGVIGRR